MALTAPRRLAALRPACHSRLSFKRLRSPTRLPAHPGRVTRNLAYRLLRWLFGER